MPPASTSDTSDRAGGVKDLLSVLSSLTEVCPTSRNVRQKTEPCPSDDSHSGPKNKDGKNIEKRGTQLQQRQQKLRMSFSNLSSVSPHELDDLVSPVLSKLKHLDALDFLKLRESSLGATLGVGGVQVTPIHDRIKPPHKVVPSPTNPTGHCVRYLHVHEEGGHYSAGVFVFPPHGKIPLHDHPGMCVLSRVLYGDITVRSYDWVDDDETGGEGSSGEDQPSVPQASVATSTVTSLLRSASKLLHSAVPHRQWSSTFDLDSDDASGLPPSSKWRRARKSKPRRIAAPEVTVLYPIQGNIHEFVAGENGAAILDVLMPPYDFEQDRDCTFYEERQRGGVTGGDNDFCWLVTTPQPESFHCISGQYAGLGDGGEIEDRG